MEQLLTTCGLNDLGLDDHACAPSDALEQVEQLYEELVSRQSELHELQAETTRQQEGLMSSIREQQQQLNEKLHQIDTGRDDLSRAEVAAQHPPQGDCDSPEIEDLQQRLQMALDEVRELKADNERMKPKLLASCASQSNSASEMSQETHDWEAQKARLLKQLDAESEVSDDQQSVKRIKIEEVLRLTDEVLADKCHEIKELKKLLDEQSISIDNVAIGAAAIGAILDSDELIVQERENLRALQAEWKSKLCEAEIEMSTERAKLTRERKELDEKLLAIERATVKCNSAEADEQAKKKGRRIWLF